jgi:peptidoglycan/xylan/chitin deacetylase (PgdA/CDA1 family)
MDRIIYFLARVMLLVFCFWGVIAVADTKSSVPILTYHRFDPSVPGSMTINTAKFEEQLKWLKDNGYTVIPLKTLVSYLQGTGPAPSEKSVVITADDGHESVYAYMFPLIRKYNIPVTLFIYPSAISNASYAMTWKQLEELQKTGLFDIQGHTYWHPNFKHEKKKLSLDEYQKFVDIQLNKSKGILEKKIGTPVTLLAWPFGIYDEYLEKEAVKAGYTMAFSIDARRASKSEKSMEQPRYMIVNQYSIKDFAAIIGGHSKVKGGSE